MPSWTRRGPMPGAAPYASASARGETADLFASTARRQLHTVSGLTAALRRVLEPSFTDVWVEGEISNWRGPHASGHCYFSLKDEGAVLSAMMFKREAQKLRFRMEEGLRVLARGRIAIYAPRGG